MRLRTLGLALTMMLGTALSWTGSAQAAGSITSYTAGLANTSPSHIVDGPEGNLWFTGSRGPFEASTPLIGTITPSGSVTTFTAGLGSGSSPYDITTGPEGNLWFTDKPVFGRGTPAIGRVTPSGAITEFTAAQDEHGEPIGLSEPLNITPGPDGNLWFTDWAYVGGQPAIGRITPNGTITEFRLPRLSEPTSIVVGPDGNLWFSDSTRLTGGTGSIGRITPSGTITLFSSGIQSGGRPSDITVGPSGNLWFTVSSNESNGPAGIGKITTGGAITEYTSGLHSESKPEDIISGPDGNLWFTNEISSGPTGPEQSAAVGRITPSGTISEFGHVAGNTSIAAGPDGNIWVSGGGLSRITPGTGQITTFWLGLVEDFQSGLGEVVAGPGGHGLWFTDSGYTDSGERTGVIGSVAGVGPLGTTPAPTVEVEYGNAGTGLVTSTPAGISCPGTCSSTFAPGTEVTLTATAAEGSYLLDPWLAVREPNGPCPAPFPPQSLPSATCRFTVNSDALYRPNFESDEESEESSGGGEVAPGGGAGGGGQPNGGGSPPVPASSNPAPSTAPSTTKPASSKQKALKCRKGFRKRTVHGKARCVKVRKHHHR